MKDYAALIAMECWPFDVNKDQRHNVQRASERLRCAKQLRAVYSPSKLETMWCGTCRPAKELPDA